MCNNYIIVLVYSIIELINKFYEHGLIHIDCK
jgi:hypothetical protein